MKSFPIVIFWGIGGGGGIVIIMKWFSISLLLFWKEIMPGCLKWFPIPLGGNKNNEMVSHSIIIILGDRGEGGIITMKWFTISLLFLG